MGRAPARAAADRPITTSGAAPLIVDGFRRVRRTTFTEGAIMERAEYKTAKAGSRHATPDAPERIDHRRRCTRHDHRTCCRGSRGSASLPCHTLRKRVEMRIAGSRGSASHSESGPQHAVAPDRTWEAHNLLNRQSLFKICVSIPSLTKSLSGTLEKFQHNNLAKNEKHQFVEAPHWQDRPGLALGIVCHRLRG